MRSWFGASGRQTLCNIFFLDLFLRDGQERPGSEVAEEEGILSYESQGETSHLPLFAFSSCLLKLHQEGYLNQGQRYSRTESQRASLSIRGAACDIASPEKQGLYHTLLSRDSPSRSNMEHEVPGFPTRGLPIWIHQCQNA